VSNDFDRLLEAINNNRLIIIDYIDIDSSIGHTVKEAKCVLRFPNVDKIELLAFEVRLTYE